LQLKTCTESEPVHFYRIFRSVSSTVVNNGERNASTCHEHFQRTPLRRILVVDDHRIVCEGLTLLLERHPSNKVVGTAATGTAAVEAAQRMRPDIVTMDLSLPDMNGIDATEHILRILPLARVIILSASHTSEHVYRAMRAGAVGYVIKDAAATELVEAVARVMAGGKYLSPMCAGLDIEAPRTHTCAKSHRKLERARA
jgi:DNA-binding NarL/FixJ family response regulator